MIVSTLDSSTLRAAYLKSNDFLYPTIHRMLVSIPGAALTRWMDMYKLTKQLNRLHGKYMHHMGMEPLRTADLRQAVTDFNQRFEHPQIRRLALLLPLVYEYGFSENLKWINRNILKGPLELTEDQRLDLLTTAVNKSAQKNPLFKRGHLIQALDKNPTSSAYPWYKRTDALQLTKEEVADLLLTTQVDFNKGPWLGQSMVGILLNWSINYGPGEFLRHVFWNVTAGTGYPLVSVAFPLNPAYLERNPRLRQLNVPGAEPLAFYRWVAGERAHSGCRFKDLTQAQLDAGLTGVDEAMFNTVATFLHECDRSHLPSAEMISATQYKLTVREGYAEHALSIRQQLKYLLEYAKWAFFHNPIS